METKRSIRDISSPNSDKIISDVVVKKTRKAAVSVSEEPNIPVNNTPINNTYINMDNMISSRPEKEYTGTINPPRKNIFSSALTKIKLPYLIGILIILILLSIFLFIPSGTKDPLEQSKKEAEMVKEELSKHMILPENEEIDIRKITSKVEDPFFQNAEIGDYLVIFYENRIAYIYSINKGLIVNAGVVFIESKTATTTNKTSQ